MHTTMSMTTFTCSRFFSTNVWSFWNCWFKTVPWVLRLYMPHIYTEKENEICWLGVWCMTCGGVSSLWTHRGWTLFLHTGRENGDMTKHSIICQTIFKLCEFIVPFWRKATILSGKLSVRKYGHHRLWRQFINCIVEVSPLHSFDEMFGVMKSRRVAASLTVSSDIDGKLSLSLSSVRFSWKTVILNFVQPPFLPTVNELLRKKMTRV